MTEFYAKALYLFLFTVYDVMIVTMWYTYKEFNLTEIKLYK